MEETLIIKKAQVGDRYSFEILYDRYSKSIYKFLYYKVASKEDAEDLSSDTWVEIVKSLRNFKFNSKFSTWAYGIAKVLLLKYYRAKYENKENVNLEEFMEIDVVDSPKTNISNASDTNYIEDNEFELNFDEDINKEQSVKYLLSKLKPIQSKVLELRFLKGYNIEEVSNELGISKSNVKIIQMRSIQKLKDIGILHLT